MHKIDSSSKLPSYYAETKRAFSQKSLLKDGEVIATLLLPNTSY